MRLLLFMGLFFLLVSAVDLNAYSRGVWQKNEAAVALIKQQQFEQALELLLQAVSETPSDKVIRKNIAVCYLGAGQQQIKAGDYLQAAEFLQEGKEFNSQDSRLWLLRGIALLKNGNQGEAESELNEAWAMSGDEPRVLQYLGQLYYESDRMFEAIDAWERALSLDPQNKFLVTRLEKAQRELKVERTLERNYSGHFILSYAESEKADIGGEVIDALEDAYTWAGSKLGHYPERQTTTILYTQRQFSGLTGSPEWAAGLYDGKIRLSIGGLNQVDDKVRALLAHEFMHVMVREMAGSRVPFWLNEGLAELASRELDDPSLDHLNKAIADQQLFAMADLDGLFSRIERNRVGLAYEQSYSFVRYLVDRFGWFQMTELLQSFKRGSTTPDVMNQVFGEYAADFTTLERDWKRQL